MATIENLEIDHFRVPLPVVLTDSMHGEMHHFGLVTVRLRDSDGAQSLGYTYTVGDTGGDAVRSLLANDVTPVVVGMDSDDIDAVWDRLWWHLHFVGRGGLAAFAMAAVDVALWDLAAIKQRQPLWRHLGGQDPKVKAYAGGIDLQFTIDALLEQADEFCATSFHAIKMKVGRDRLSEDCERVEAMRTHLGDDFCLLADANMRWSVDEAVKAAQALSDSNLFWLEEPTIPDDIKGHAIIAKEGGVPIATGENFHSTYEFEHMIDAGQITYPEPDLATLGGITPWLKVAAYAASKNLAVTSHGVHDLHVHLLSAVQNNSLLEVHGFGLDAYMQDSLVLDEAGNAIAPERPGHGVQFDFEKLKREASV